ncbi:hypothetical protein CHS0354_031248 [Potamilus streckersoni]|uniref:Uncharacterized protein n=1 Tax=Potamilus streckersoni TaxID=2493646 RepID=A0AAE0SC73_9BIVA|nr:hypothetical protein CHS0354_031248 [Potamilus streckersoni]
MSTIHVLANSQDSCQYCNSPTHQNVISQVPNPDYIRRRYPELDNLPNPDYIRRRDQELDNHPRDMYIEKLRETNAARLSLAEIKSDCGHLQQTVVSLIEYIISLNSTQITLVTINDHNAFRADLNNKVQTQSHKIELLRKEIKSLKTTQSLSMEKELRVELMKSLSKPTFYADVVSTLSPGVSNLVCSDQRSPSIAAQKKISVSNYLIPILVEERSCPTVSPVLAEADGSSLVTTTLESRIGINGPTSFGNGNGKNPMANNSNVKGADSKTSPRKISTVIRGQVESPRLSGKLNLEIGSKNIVGHEVVQNNDNKVVFKGVVRWSKQGSFM